MSPTNRMGTTAIHAPVPMPGVEVRSRLSERYSRVVGELCAPNAPPIECPERNAKTESSSGAVLGPPACARAKVIAVIAATVSQIHAVLFLFPVILNIRATKCSSHIVPQMGKMKRMPISCSRFLPNNHQPFAHRLHNLLVDFIDPQVALD